MAWWYSFHWSIGYASVILDEWITFVTIFIDLPIPYSFHSARIEAAGTSIQAVDFSDQMVPPDFNFINNQITSKDW